MEALIDNLQKYTRDISMRRVSLDRTPSDYVRTLRQYAANIPPSELTGRDVQFFFQAEDGIRGRNVTGVQTCALPIYIRHLEQRPPAELLESGRRIFQCRAVPAANRYCGSQRSQTICDRAADAAAAAGHQCDASREPLLFPWSVIYGIYCRHENSPSRGPLFLCDTHLIISDFDDGGYAVRRSERN